MCGEPVIQLTYSIRTLKRLIQLSTGPKNRPRSNVIGIPDDRTKISYFNKVKRSTVILTCSYIFDGKFSTNPSIYKISKLSHKDFLQNICICHYNSRHASFIKPKVQNIIIIFTLLLYLIYIFIKFCPRKYFVISYLKTLPYFLIISISAFANPCYSSNKIK